MLMTGELEVRKQGQRLGFLSDGAFFGEVPILDDSMGSQIRLRTITAMTDSRLCFITADAIAGEPPRFLLVSGLHSCQDASDRCGQACATGTRSWPCG